MRRSIGYGRYGQWKPDFTVCKSEGGTANCPDEYVKEFSGLRGIDVSISGLSLVLMGVVAAVAVEYVTKKPIIQWATFNKITI